MKVVVTQANNPLVRSVAMAPDAGARRATRWRQVLAAIGLLLLLPMGSTSAFGQAYDGVLLYQRTSISRTVQNPYSTTLLASDGSVIHEWANPLQSPEGTVAYLRDDGLLLRSGAYDIPTLEPFPPGPTGVVQLVDWDGNVAWEYSHMSLADGYVLHHDLEPMANGNILALSYVGISPTEAASLGIQTNGVVYGDSVMELKPNLDTGTTEIVWEWNSWDHIIQDTDPNASTYGVVADNSGKIDYNYTNRADDKVHFNAVDYNAELDQILLTSLAYNEIWIIDHATTTEEAAGEDGDLLWRWGNPAAYDQGTQADQLISGMHDANWVAEGLPGAGNILVHNNGSYPGQTTGDTQILELDVLVNPDGSYALNPDGTYDATIEWLYDEGNYTRFMGGAERLPNGNTLISEATSSRVFEVTPDGTVVNVFDLGQNVQFFKAHMYNAAMVPEPGSLALLALGGLLLTRRQSR